MARDVYIHAGAHRTGTSSFQLCLATNRDALRDKGYDAGFPHRGGIDGGALRLILKQRPKVKLSHDDWIAKMRADFHRQYADASRPLLLSEENIPGQMIQFYWGKFYPAAEDRLQVLSELLVSQPKHLLYVIRPYSELFVSAYRLRASGTRIAPFETYSDAFVSMDRGWPELIDVMQRALQPVRMTVVTYEQRGTSLELLGKLVPDLDLAGLTEPARSLNISPTDAALQAIQARFASGEDLSRDACAALIEAHVDETDKRGVASFANTAAEQLDRRYQNDLGRIAAMPGVVCLT
ncbi:MAG: hypothetical protein AAFR45_09860 [Pseudomonadota bacterium]